jgi:hypothetical protein
VELCKIFGVKRLTVFALDFTKVGNTVKEAIEGELREFNQLVTP